MTIVMCGDLVSKETGCCALRGKVNTEIHYQPQGPQGKLAIVKRFEHRRIISLIGLVVDNLFHCYV